MTFKFESCETCTTPKDCGKAPMSCAHNAAVCHCRYCGSILINHGVEGHHCESEECRRKRALDEEALRLPPDPDAHMYGFGGGHE